MDKYDCAGWLLEKLGGAVSILVEMCHVKTHSSECTASNFAENCAAMGTTKWDV
jgi:hypothetical protein